MSSTATDSWLPSSSMMSACAVSGISPVFVSLPSSSRLRDISYTLLTYDWNSLRYPSTSLSRSLIETSERGTRLPFVWEAGFASSKRLWAGAATLCFWTDAAEGFPLIRFKMFAKFFALLLYPEYFSVLQSEGDLFQVFMDIYSFL